MLFVGAGLHNTNISVAIDDVKITTKECEIHPTFALPGKSVKVECLCTALNLRMT